MSLSLYTVHHLNLAYSSIDEDRRQEVFERCYWPLLYLASSLGVPLGIEATAYTLEEIDRIDSSWLRELRRLLQEGSCEFVGSGFAQIIGPLVPAAVNAANLRLGLQRYQDLLGTTPRVALLNEQAYSSGVVSQFRKAGLGAVIMEWENPATANPQWPREWQYHPQRVSGSDGNHVNLLWNHSIAFQQFQRYAHGDIDLGRYLSFLRSHDAEDERSLCLYGNDVEVFDFRPGRYRTEAVHTDDEWRRIQDLYRELQDDAGFRLILPSVVLSESRPPLAGNLIEPQTSDVPIPVKKQNKYNVTRWAVTGRDDLGINSACWRIYEALMQSGTEDPEAWRELCYLWSSDFRTHITERRWKAYRERLARAEARFVPRGPALARHVTSTGIDTEIENHITVDTGPVSVHVSRRRGLAIESLTFPALGTDWLCGTLPHGHYRDISWAADFYTGNLVFEAPGAHKVTDLEVARDVQRRECGEYVQLLGWVDTALGPVHKTITVSRTEPTVDIDFRIEWRELPLGSLRLGFVLLNPRAFARSELVFRTHNGGSEMESFPLQVPVNHGAAVSHLVSARQALGMTEGVIEIGDRKRGLCVSVDKGLAAMVGMITCEDVDDSYVCRLEFSAAEIDDTRKPVSLEAGGRSFKIRITGIARPSDARAADAQ